MVQLRPDEWVRTCSGSGNHRRLGGRRLEAASPVGENPNFSERRNGLRRLKKHKRESLASTNSPKTTFFDDSYNYESSEPFVAITLLGGRVELKASIRCSTA
jgi:hypothetical protein